MKLGADWLVRRVAGLVKRVRSDAGPKWRPISPRPARVRRKGPPADWVERVRHGAPHLLEPGPAQSIPAPDTIQRPAEEARWHSPRTRLPSDIPAYRYAQLAPSTRGRKRSAVFSRTILNASQSVLERIRLLTKHLVVVRSPRRRPAMGPQLPRRSLLPPPARIEGTAREPRGPLITPVDRVHRRKVRFPEPQAAGGRLDALVPPQETPNGRLPESPRPEPGPAHYVRTEISTAATPGGTRPRPQRGELPAVHLRSSRTWLSTDEGHELDPLWPELPTPRREDMPAWPNQGHSMPRTVHYVAPGDAAHREPTTTRWAETSNVSKTAPAWQAPEDGRWPQLPSLDRDALSGHERLLADLKRRQRIDREQEGRPWNG
jgi:hypothetical protein